MTASITQKQKEEKQNSSSNKVYFYTRYNLDDPIQNLAAWIIFKYKIRLHIQQHQRKVWYIQELSTLRKRIPELREALKSKSSRKFSKGTSQFKSQLQLKIIRRKNSKITINIMKTRSQSAKDTVQDSSKREGNAERENTSILYVCLTDDKFISKAKSSFYVPKTMTSGKEKYTELKNDKKEKEK